MFARGVLLVEGIADEYLIAAAAKVRKNLDLDFNEIAVVESGGKDKVITFMAVLRKLGLKTWGLLDLDFLWNGAGEVFKGDDEYSSFREALDKLALTNAAPATEADKKDEKRKKVEACNRELTGNVQSLATKLIKEGLYVLRRGEIETYFGMSNSSKSQYMKVARAVLSGERKIEHAEDLDQLFSDLETWALSTQ
jgi:hypothetical protein